MNFVLVIESSFPSGGSVSFQRDYCIKLNVALALCSVGPQPARLGLFCIMLIKYLYCKRQYFGTINALGVFS